MIIVPFHTLFLGESHDIRIDQGAADLPRRAAASSR